MKDFVIIILLIKQLHDNMCVKSVKVNISTSVFRQTCHPCHGARTPASTKPGSEWIDKTRIGTD
jgi:cytochrome c5